MGAIAALITIIVMVIFVVIFVASYFSSFATMDQKLQEGCVPMTNDRYGIATSYSCPVP